MFPSGISNTNFPSFLINSTTLPGINLVSICYQRNGAACKVAELNLKGVYSLVENPHIVKLLSGSLTGKGARLGARGPCL